MHIHSKPKIRSNALKILFILCVIALVAAKEQSAYGYVKQLLGWKQREPAEEAKDEIPEWSVYGGKKEEPKSAFGVDDYSTGATVDTTATMDDSSDFRPPPPKDAPPPLPEEVDVDEDSSSVVSDLTVDDEEDFHDAQAMDDEDEFHDAVQEEL